MDTNVHEFRKRQHLYSREFTPKVILFVTPNLLFAFIRAIRGQILSLFVSICVHSWLAGLGSGGQRRAQMPNFVFYVVSFFARLPAFPAHATANRTGLLVALSFSRRLGAGESR